MKRKGLAILLALCLVLSMMTIVASAASGDTGKIKSESISVEDSDVIFRVVRGGRIEIASKSADEDGSYSWTEEENDGIVKILANTDGKALILEAEKEGTASFKLVVDKDETLFNVQVITDKKGVTIIPEELVVTVDGTASPEAVYNDGTAEDTDAKFTWGSKDPTIARVDKDTGKVTGVKKGSTEITAQTTADGENYTGSCKVTVEDPLNIEYAKDDHGKVTGPEKAPRQSVVTVTADPNKDYTVTAIKVTRKDDKTEVANKKTSGDGKQTLSFEMPDTDVTVSAVFEAKEEPADPVDPTAKYKVSVNPVKNGKVTVSKETAEKGEPVQIGSTIAVNYTGRLLNGKVFDTSIEKVAKENNIVDPGRKYEPFEYQVGATSLIRGWEEGLINQPAGSSLTLIMPSRLGYGTRENNAIPANSPLVFDIEIVSVK